MRAESYGRFQDRGSSDDVAGTLGVEPAGQGLIGSVGPLQSICNSTFTGGHVYTALGITGVYKQYTQFQPGYRSGSRLPARIGSVVVRENTQHRPG